MQISRTDSVSSSGEKKKIENIFLLQSIDRFFKIPIAGKSVDTCSKLVQLIVNV